MRFFPLLTEAPGVWQATLRSIPEWKKPTTTPFKKMRPLSLLLLVRFLFCLQREVLGAHLAESAPTACR
ncbi:hypothetical protein LEMLEM_LOCUS23219 [Lemmus lemmus]